VDTQGLVLEARVLMAHRSKTLRGHQAALLDTNARDRLPERLSQLWLDAGYTAEEKGADWAQKVLGWTAQIVRHPPKLVPEEVIGEMGKRVDQRGSADHSGEAARRAEGF
jgi:hypothetical protein